MRTRKSRARARPSRTEVPGFLELAREEAKNALQYARELGRSEAARLRVLLARVVRGEQSRSPGQWKARTVRERIWSAARDKAAVLE